MPPSTTISTSISCATSRRSRAWPARPTCWWSIPRAGQDGSRIHRLCQGQSGQDQYGVGRQWQPEPYVRRIVQDHGRHRHGARALSRRSFLPDLLAGQVQAVFSPISQSIGYIRVGKLRALAVTSRRGRRHCRISRASPNLYRATRRAAGTALGAPKNTPADIMSKLSQEITGLSPIPTRRHNSPI